MSKGTMHRGGNGSKNPTPPGGIVFFLQSWYTGAKANDSAGRGTRRR